MSERGHVEKLLNDSSWLESFMDKFEEADGPLDTPCLVWTGGTDRSGYGRVHIKRHCEKNTGRNFFTHRLAYMAQRGYITPEEYVLHQCHVRLCGNADHHKIGDHNDNMDDLANSRRVAGSNNHNSKINEDDALEILELYYEEEWSISELMEEFELGKGTVTDLIYGRTWRDVYDEYWSE